MPSRTWLRCQRTPLNSRAAAYASRISRDVFLIFVRLVPPVAPAIFVVSRRDRALAGAGAEAEAPQQTVDDVG